MTLAVQQRRTPRVAEKQDDQAQEAGPGSVIKAAREKARLTRDELAERVGIGGQYLYQLETGRRPMPLETAHTLAIALGLDPSTIDQRLAGSLLRPAVGGEKSPCPGTLTLVVGEDGEPRPATEADRACLDRKKPETVRALVAQGRELGRAREDLAPDGTTAVTYRLKP